MRKSIIGKIIILFIVMFLLLLTPAIVQNVTSIQQTQLYRELLDNIIYTNQLNTDVVENIEQVVWNIVAGKENFEDSGIWSIVSGIRMRMLEIRNNTDSPENRGIMDMSMNALTSLENYLGQLYLQIQERAPVAENEILLEDIRICIAGIDDLLRD